MSRCVHETDRLVLVVDGRVLGSNGDAPFALQIIGVEDTVIHLLIRTKDIRLLQHAVKQGRLAMIDVGDDGDISQIVGAIGQSGADPGCGRNWPWAQIEGKQ